MSEKTEEPTAKKLDDARRKGQSPKSTDLVAGVVLACSVLALMAAGGLVFDRVSHAVALAFGPGIGARTVEGTLALVSEIVLAGIVASAPLVLVTMLGAAIALFAQVGFRISPEAVTPKFDKLNPGQGLKKLVNVRSLVELAKALVKAAALGSVIWVVVRGLVPAVVGAGYLSAAGAAAVAWQALLKLLAASVAVFVVIGPLDFALQRWMFRRDNKMSKDEVKREFKEQDGDPQLKGERRALQEEMAMSAPQQRVPGATVVVTNPTHYAVALFYIEGETPLPIVICKGMDEQAAVIRALAQAHGVPIVANPPLARALHKLPLDAGIPDELFAAVSVVLKWVQQIKASKPAP